MEEKVPFFEGIRPCMGGVRVIFQGKWLPFVGGKARCTAKAQLSHSARTKAEDLPIEALATRTKTPAAGLAMKGKCSFWKVFMETEGALHSGESPIYPSSHI